VGKCDKKYFSYAVVGWAQARSADTHRSR